MRSMPFILVCVLAIMSLTCYDNTVVRMPPDDPNTGGRPIFLGNPPAAFNEVNPANIGYKDEFGDTPGWVELYNPADTAVNLDGYYLTGNSGKKQWKFGDVAVGPGGYLTVFLSGRDRPSLDMPGNDLDLLRGAVGAWPWADSQNRPTAGGSTAEHDFPYDKSYISGILKAVNNPVLGWTSAVVMLVQVDWDTTRVVDLSGISQVQFRGYINKGAELDVRFAHLGVPDWEAWGKVLTGTGVENDLYTIDLPPANSGTFDPKTVYGVRFGNNPSYRGTIEFKFTSIMALRRISSPHASFELSGNGGKLFLLDGEGHIRDSVAYLAGVRELSYAKRADGGWSLSKPPTPNAANDAGQFYDSQLRPPSSTDIPRSGYHADSLTFTLPSESDGSVTCCDTSGRLPTDSSALRSGAAVTLKKTTVMRCARFKQGSYQSDPIMRTYIVGERLPSLPVVSIAVDPFDMFDRTHGLYSMGPNAHIDFPHFGANFWKDTELPIHIDFFENGARHAWSCPAGAKIAGNWSRGNAKKSVNIRFRERYGQKNLKYALFPEYPHLTHFKSFVLRNNGNNFPNDYIRDMLMASLTEGLDIDYQKGREVIVYYNGRYFGIHNMRERSNRHLVKTNYGVEKEDLDLVKVRTLKNGSDADYQDILRMLENVAPLDDNTLRILSERIDIDNYTNHVQSRVFYVDKDWPGNNFRRWRSTSLPDTRWRWIMYDTDHGFDSYGKNEQRNVKMLDFVTTTNGPSDWPNPPWSTFLTRKLLENEGYKNAFINRFSLLLTTTFAPERIEARIDALMAPIESEISLDQKRWVTESHWRTFAYMEEQLDIIRAFGRDRPAQMQKEIEEFFKLSGPVDLTVKSGLNGKVYVDGLPVPNGSATFKAYAAVPVTLKAVPNHAAYAFDGWDDGIKEEERVVTVTEAMTLTAKFRGMGL